MASRKDLVTLVCERQEKQDFATAKQDLIDQILFDVNRAYRYAYNASDLSYKTRILEGFVYYGGAFLAGNNPVPSDFLSFQQTGRVYDNSTDPPHELTYIPWHDMVDWLIGRKKNMTGAPRYYSHGGRSDQMSSLRDFAVAPSPNISPLSMTLVYQATPQADGVAAAPPDPNSWENEITPMPVWLHTTVLLDMAILFRKMDKGLDQKAQNAILDQAFKQMLTQEPHGREKPRTLPRFPAWGGRRRWAR